MATPPLHKQTGTGEAAPAESHIKNPLVRVLSIAGLIVLLLLGAWGIIRIALYLPTALTGTSGAFSSLFTREPEAPAQEDQKLTVTGPNETISAESPFTLSWNHMGGEGSYAYEISYGCESGFSVDAPLPSGNFQPVACNTPFNYTDARNSIPLIAHLGGSQREVTVPFSVSAAGLATGTPAVSGTTTLAFASRAGAATTPPTGSAGAAKKHTGAADLSVRILSASATGARFEIRNAGGTTVPAGWIFTAALPVSPAYTYLSAPQQAIQPGGYIINTLNWDGQRYYPQNCPAYPYQQNPYYGGYDYNCAQQPYGGYYAGGVLTIVADAYGIVRDANRANNTARITVY